MKRALILVEGQTEKRFVKDVLRKHLWAVGLDLAPTLLITKPVKAGGSFRGGITNFAGFTADARRLLHDSGGILVTTMLDYYRLPSDFPGLSNRPQGSSRQRIEHVEQAIRAHFGNPPNFFPHRSLHEFEALLFVEPPVLVQVIAEPDSVAALQEIRRQFKSPEDINERPGMSPSERILGLFSGYRKVLHGPAALSRIGLDRLREECPHFSAWMTLLEDHARSP